jgi:hypothetical protein
MILKTLLILACTFALFWQIRMKKTFPMIITGGLIIGILMVLLPIEIVHAYGFYVYMGFVAMAFAYGVAFRGINIGTRIVIMLMSASIFMYWLWVLNHWHGNELLAPIFTLIVGLVGIIGRFKLKNELGFLIILAVDAIAIILEHWMKVS